MKHLLILLIILFGISCSSKKKEVTIDSDIYYTCSMDPQVIELKPGKCPICKMPLTPVKKSTNGNKDEIQLSDQQVQLGNIHVDTIRSGTIGNKMVLTATLNTDQSKIAGVSTRLMGRIDKLYFRNTGDYVKKGDKLYDLY